MKKTEKTIMKIGIILIILMVIIPPIIFGGDESNPSKEVDFDIKNKSAVLHYVQGRWQGEVHTGDESTNMHYRIMIEGTTMTVYTKHGYGQWDMNSPRSVHSISISQLSNTLAGNPRRFVVVENPSLAVRSFTPLEVNEVGFFNVDHILSFGWK